MYLVQEIVNAIQRDLSLDDQRNVIERHPRHVSQHIKNCGNGSAEWSKFEDGQGLPDIAEKTFAAVISSFMMTVYTSECQHAPPNNKARSQLT